MSKLDPLDVYRTERPSLLKDALYMSDDEAKIAIEFMQETQASKPGRSVRELNTLKMLKEIYRLRAELSEAREQAARWQAHAQRLQDSQ